MDGQHKVASLFRSRNQAAPEQKPDFITSDDVETKAGCRSGLSPL
jgi:hypothetical protein